MGVLDYISVPYSVQPYNRLLEQLRAQSAPQATSPARYAPLPGPASPLAQAGPMETRRVGGSPSISATNISVDGQLASAPPAENLPIPPVPPTRPSSAQTTLERLRRGAAGVADPSLPIPPEPPPGGAPQDVPVVTSGGAAANRSLMDLLRERTVAEQSQGDGASVDRQLMDFGAGMASGNSPHFAQNFGAGLRALSAGDQQRTNNLRQASELDVNDRYRQAVVAVQQAQLAYEQRPDNPRNQLALAHAQYYVTQAREAVLNGAANRANLGSGGGGSNNLGPATLVVDPQTGRPSLFYGRSGTTVAIPEGQVPAAMLARANAAAARESPTDITLRRQALAELSRDPMFGMQTPEQQTTAIERRAAQLRTQMPVRTVAPVPGNVMPGGAPAPVAAAPAAGPTVRPPQDWRTN